MTENRLNAIWSIQNDGYDDISYEKRLILERLYKDSDVIEILNNPNLDPDIPDEYINVNIFTRIVIPNTENVVKNYICFEVDDTEDLYSNNVMLNKVVTFMVVSHKDDINTIWGIDRHDLLAYLIKDLFNWSNLLGTQIKKFYDIADVVDDGYHFRIIKFRTTSTNGLVNGESKNKYDK